MKPTRPKAWRRWCPFAPWERGKPFLKPVMYFTRREARFAGHTDVRLVEIREVVAKPKPRRKR